MKMTTRLESSPLPRIAARLQLDGYEVRIEADRLVVADPVHSCGQGDQAGRLVLTGYVDVVIRNWSDADRFLAQRS